MKALPWILVTLLVLIVLFLWGRQQEQSVLLRPDTTEYVETIPFYYPVPRDSIIKRYETIRLPVKDETHQTKQDTFMPDSVEIDIPITQKVYEDSLYHAWVSGYNIRLDSIKVYAQIREVKMPMTVLTKRKRWGLGLQAGYGYPSGLYIGLGVSYNLFSW